MVADAYIAQSFVGHCVVFMSRAKWLCGSPEAAPAPLCACGSSALENAHHPPSGQWWAARGIKQTLPFMPFPKVVGSCLYPSEQCVGTTGCRSPLHIHGGEGKGYPFEQQHHEEPLAERAVAHTLPVLACLWAKTESSATPAPHSGSGCGLGPWLAAGQRAIQTASRACYAGHSASPWPLPAHGASVPHPRAACVAQ